MDSAAVLTPTDINTIRRYVHTKYAPLPGNRRAEIVADAIRRTLQQRLPRVPVAMKNQLVDRLIARCLLGERRDVQPEDVLDLCAELYSDDSAFGEQILEPILNWVNERAPGRWNEEQLASRLVRSSAYGLALTQELPPVLEQGNPPSGATLRKRLTKIPVLALLTAIIVIGGTGIAFVIQKPEAVESESMVVPQVVAKLPEPLPDVGMPERLQYTEIDAKELIAYLNSRDSMLAEDPYFSAIVDNAREYDIHPLLLFAITGQEQGFVPKTSKDAKLIANNPFNVGHSWMEYNTDIHNSAGIASRLIVKLAKSRPEGHDPFTWFNKTYAEDPLWSVGVRKIFDKLNNLPKSQ
jgi:hypothetical protein